MPTRRKPWSRIGGIFAAGLLSIAPPAHAVDGVLEINRVCAVAGGCFPGDAPGYPVTINRAVPASYRLTSTLDIGSANTTVIEIVDANVVIDLNGFAISGPNVCSGVPLECTALGTGMGVSASAPGVTVRNGTVRGMGARGLSLGASAHVEDVLAVSNGTDAIAVAPESVVRSCRTIRNKGVGIIAAGGAEIASNVILGNASNAIDTVSYGSTGGSLIRDNVVKDNVGLAYLHPGDGYAGNVFRGNAAPQVFGGISIGGNVCGSVACP